MMPEFHYSAVTPAGITRKGRAQGEDADVIIQRLRAEGLLPLTVRRKSSFTGIWTHERTLPDRDLFIILNSLASFLNGGVRLKEALSIMLKGQTAHKHRRHFIETTRERLAAGQSLSSAFETNDSTTPRFRRSLLALIRAGEESGDLGRALQEASTLVQTDIEFRKKIQSSLAYPSIVVFVAFLTIMFMGTVIAPAFKELFDDFGRPLPPMLGLLLGVNGATPYILSILIVFLIAIKRPRSWAGGARFDRSILQLPMAGNFIVQKQTAEFCFLLSSLLKGGVPLIPALELSRQSFANSAIESDFRAAIKNVEDGLPFSDALEKIPYLPGDFIQMARLGESNGTLPHMLRQAAYNLRTELDERLEKIMIILPPVLICLLGGLIAGLVGSVFTAILDINQLATK